MAERQGTPLIDFTDESGAHKKQAGCGDLGDSNPDQEDRWVSEEESLEEIEKSQLPPRQSGRAWRTHVRFSDTVKRLWKILSSTSRPLKSRKRTNGSRCWNKSWIPFISWMSWTYYLVHGTSRRKWLLAEERCLLLRDVPPIIHLDMLLLIAGKCTSLGWHVHHSEISLLSWTETSTVNCTCSRTTSATNYIWVSIGWSSPCNFGMRSWRTFLKVCIHADRVVQVHFIVLRWHAWSDHFGLRGRLSDESQTQWNQMGKWRAKEPVQNDRLGRAKVLLARLFPTNR